MIIRSQNKCVMVDVEHMASVVIKDYTNYDDEYLILADKWILGTYSTEEKAIKVLDMICENYQYLQEFKCGLTEMGVQKVDFVFQMPQDSEV